MFWKLLAIGNVKNNTNSLLKLTIIQRKSLNKFLVHKNIKFSLYNRHKHFYSSIYLTLIRLIGTHMLFQIMHGANKTTLMIIEG